MKIQKIFYVLVLGLLMLTLTGATSVMAQNSNDNNKTSHSCCPGGGKPITECTPAEKAACQPMKCDTKTQKCDTKTQKCDPSACNVPSETKKDNSGK
ncbi:MAG: hypothetical protein GY865_16085 [candidate division Zixibacteria bacterium]|nr:hypothetical protein [candidate division Zixibacteria bacterium]